VECTVSDDVKPGFIRQRRFLVLTSLLLAAKYVVGLSVAQDITALGVEFHIDRREHVPVLLWIVWAWALYRYYVYLHDLTAAEFVSAAAVRHNPYLAKIAVPRSKEAAIARERKVDKPDVTLTARSIEHQGSAGSG
jgi:hypothetical protein